MREFWLARNKMHGTYEIFEHELLGWGDRFEIIHLREVDKQTPEGNQIQFPPPLPPNVLKFVKTTKGGS